ncbi:CidA/LrgA family protein [Halalkalibacterium ligniniphilum]|uniref:CidA/LrgA family protein n=1 Tax=Halalkalibacterium ligniniphilum TaxID=1134413 RepID=UPI000344AA05|nr:CidA/LrgA family protein [Halalkalibacterium ligniniphilum]
MNLIRITFHICILYGFYRMGAWIQETFALFIPGSIIGLFLLLLLFITKIMPVEFVEQGTQVLLKYMPMLFLPVIVGVMQYPQIFLGKELLLIVITLFSTIMVMAVSGLLTQWMAVKKEQKS